MATFDLCVLYSQIGIYAVDPPCAFDWTDEHVAQGFVWREDVVWFGVPDHDGDCRIDVAVGTPNDETHGRAVRIIKVPFRADRPTIEVGTVMEGVPISVPAGGYQLWFMLLEPDDAGAEDEEIGFDVVIRLEPSDDPEFAIVRGGGEVTADRPTRFDATIA